MQLKAFRTEIVDGSDIHPNWKEEFDHIIWHVYCGDEIVASITLRKKDKVRLSDRYHISYLPNPYLEPSIHATFDDAFETVKSEVTEFVNNSLEFCNKIIEKNELRTKTSRDNTKI